MEYPESGSTVEYTPDVSLNVTKVVNQFGENTLSEFAYDYCADHNQRRKTARDGTVTAYVYDGMGRLKTETEKRETGENTIAYEYDRFGNRAKMVRTGAENSVTEYVYDLGNRLLTETKTEKQDTETTTYTYDANGSQTSKETR